LPQPALPRQALSRHATALLALTALLGGCSTNATEVKPPTIEAARAAVSPPPVAAPAGRVVPLGGRPAAAVFERATASLVVFTPAAGASAPATLNILGAAGTPRNVALPGGASAVAGDERGTLYAATRGGVLTVDLAAGTVDRMAVPGQADTDFTAIARRADGRLVLGSADGTVYTLAPDLTVTKEVGIFARIDAIVAESDTAVVLDRGQTSVTALSVEGNPQQALRAGTGATTIATDPAGRVLVADTRGGQLLVFSVRPLIARQAYPVPGAPYGLTGSLQLTWVSQTATNTVVGYDLATGIPVEKVRYPTVQQPNSLAFDDASGTLYVVSGSGAGVQVIPNAAGTP